MPPKPKPISCGRKNAYKKGIDAVEGRRKREEGLVQIRKSKRQDNLFNRRRPSTHHLLLRLQPQLESLPLILKGVFSDDYQAQLAAATQLRLLISDGDCPPIEEVVSTGIVPQLVEFLDIYSPPELQFEACWALANIASSKHDQILIRYNAIPKFVGLLRSPMSAIRDQAVWALANLVGDSGINRDMVLNHGALMPLLTHLDSIKELSMIRSVTWALQNICQAKPPCPFDQIRAMVQPLARLINLEDENVLIDACSAISYITGGEDETIQVVIDAGICHRLVQLLHCPSVDVLVPALRALENIAAGNESQTQVVIDEQVLPLLDQILTRISYKNVKTQACRVISNITAGNQSQIQAVIDANIVATLINLLQRGEFDVKKEAALAISNATCGSVDQIYILVSQGCVKPLCDLLTCSDPRTVDMCLDAIESILESGESFKDASRSNIYVQRIYECDGIDKIEGLLSHNNIEIYDKVVKILDKYWVKEEMEEDWQNLQAGFNLRSLRIA